MKDNFSSRSEDYSRYRPKYPLEAYRFIKSSLQGFEKAWDCGTGNGQVAGEIAQFFKEVKATDVSTNQIGNAVKKSNIEYSVQPAETTNFLNNEFDLIITAQAVHWFNFDKFYAEVKRCLKPEGIFVIMGYGLFSANAETNTIINRFYNQIIGPYWDPERKYLEANYKTIPFPFTEMSTPQFKQNYEWKIQELLGYLRTWSAVRHFEKDKKQDPVLIIEEDLKKAFGQKNNVSFPILFRMGKSNFRNN